MICSRRLELGLEPQRIDGFIDPAPQLPIHYSAQHFNWATFAFAESATLARKLLGMLPSIGYQGFRTAPIPSCWVQLV